MVTGVVFSLSAQFVQVHRMTPGLVFSVGYRLFDQVFWQLAKPRYCDLYHRIVAHTVVL